MSTYVFGSAWERERERLDALEGVADITSCALLERLGVPADAVCVEVGAGGGSMACWLADRVGPGGRVVATDVDLTWLRRLGREDLELRQHDIATDDLEADSFDVVHTRTVLEHVPARDTAVERLVRALRPGGLLLIEDVDLDSAGGCLARANDLPLARRIQAAIREVMRAAGTDTGWAATLPAKLHGAGLVGVGATLTNAYLWGGDERGDVVRITVERVRDQIEERGLLTPAEVDDFLERTTDPAFHWASLPVISAWGRRPI